MRLLERERTRIFLVAPLLGVLLLFSSCSREPSSALTDSAPDDVSTPWTLMRHEGRTLFVMAGSGGCLRFDRMAVDETPDVVTVRALSVRKVPPVDSPEPSATPVTARTCTAELSLHAESVCLESPLGDRELVHAPISPDGPTQKSVDHVPQSFRESDPCE